MLSWTAYTDGGAEAKTGAGAGLATLAGAPLTLAMDTCSTGVEVTPRMSMGASLPQPAKDIVFNPLDTNISGRADVPLLEHISTEIFP